MLALLTAILFLLVAAGTSWAGLHAIAWNKRRIHRLSPVSATPAGLVPSRAMIWRELVNRIGTAVPASGRDLPRLKRRLIRAGYRNPNAARNFQGVRPVATVIFAVVALLCGWQAQATLETLVKVAIAGALAGYVAPMQYIQLRTRHRQSAIARGLPNALDLMVVCVESGLGIDQTMIQVAKDLQSAHPEICSEFTVVNLEMRAGKRRAEALHNLADRTGVEDVKKLVAVLVQTDRFGTSIAQCLRGHADYLRTLARQKAEERASKLAVKLVFPIFFCVLPSLFVVTIGPVMMRLVRDLIPMIENM
jgi:tight adherence protein C